jgi:hypothetical protein
MTVENIQNKMPPLQMGSTTQYPFTFAVLLQDPTEEEALKAIKARVLLADGKEVELVYETDYTVELNTNRIGGTVTVKNARTSADYITIFREYDQTQEVDYRDFNSAPAETFEQCFDKLTMLSQQQQEQIDRSLKFSVSSTSINPSLPEPIANNTLIWNEEGTDFKNYDIISENNAFKADVNFNIAQGQANIQTQLDTFEAEQIQQLEQFKTEQTGAFETFKTEQTGAFEEYKEDINTDIETVLDAAGRIEQLEGSVATAITAANEANTAASNATEAAKQAITAASSSANKDLSNLTETGENKFVKTADLVEVNFVKKSGDTMTGNLVVENGYIYNKGVNNQIDITATTAPSSTLNGGMYNLRDKNNEVSGQVINQLDNNGYLRTSLVARRNVNGTIKTAQIWACIKHDGTVATYAPTPATNDNSTKIATTGWVTGNVYPNYSKGYSRSVDTEYTVADNGVLLLNAMLGSQLTVTINDTPLHHSPNTNGQGWRCAFYFLLKKGDKFKFSGVSGVQAIFYPVA